MNEPPSRDAKHLVLWALCANISIAISKIVIAAITHSSSILAEAVHSLADTINQLLLLYGMKQSRKLPSLLHPFGYARESYFWSFMVAVLMFTLGGFFAVYQGFNKLLAPHPMEHFGLAYLVLILSMIFEGIAFSKAWRTVAAKRKTNSIYKFLKHSKEPALIVVFLEDLIAEIGLAIALIGVGLTHATGNSTYDAVSTIVIGALLCGMAIFITFEIRSLIVGERASQLDEYKIRKAIRDSESVEEVVKLSTQHLGPDEIMVAMNCKFPDYFNSQEMGEAIDRISANIRAVLPQAKQIFIEPELGQEPDEG